MQSAAYHHRSQKYQFRNLITSNGMLPPGTLHLDVVTRRTRHGPEIHLTVTEATETETAAPPRQGHPCLRRHGRGHAQYYPRSRPIRAAGPM